MGVQRRFIWNYGGTEMLALFSMEVKEHGACFSFSLWLPDKPNF